MASDKSNEDLTKIFGRVKEPILLYEGTVSCPVCGKRTLKLREYLYEVPYFGRIIISTGKCSNCNYTYRDVRLAETTKPKKIVVPVEGERSLRWLLVKSAYAYLSIPEVGYEMIPGPASHGLISTVEGVLHRFMEALEVACKDRWNVDKSCRDNKKWLEEAINGRRRFTLVICDYEGASKVVGDKVIETQLDQECLRKKPEWMTGRL